MKKVAYLALLATCLAIGLLYWHFWETEARMQYRMAGVAAIDWAEEKISEGWSEENAEHYADMKLDSLGITYPNRCPYCYIKSLIK